MKFDDLFKFDPAKRFHIGVEEEVWTVNPDTGLLVSGALKVFVDGYENRWPGFKPELPAQQIEVITPPCGTLDELETALRRNDDLLQQAAEEYGFRISRDPIPTKPFAIEVFPKERYQFIQRKHGERLRSAYVAGLHIHVGLGSREEAVAAMNVLRMHLARFLSFSARSPSYDGVHPYGRSVRYLEYSRMAGETVPPFLKDWNHFRAIADACGFTKDPRMCWWALRISPHGTIELRVCDIQERVEKTMALAALMRLLVKLSVNDAHGDIYPRDISVEPLADALQEAALHRVDPTAYLNKTRRIASREEFDEERPYLAELKV